MKYYFITYQGVRRDDDPSISIWHDVTDLSPMEYRQGLISAEEDSKRKSYYMDFLILTTEEITEEQFKKWDGKF